MKIALVIGTLGLGGTEKQICHFARELQSRNHSVKVFAVSESGPLAEELRNERIAFEVFHFPGFTWRDPEHRLAPRLLFHGFAVVQSFWRSLWRFEPDVCHAFLPWAYILALPGAAIGRVPCRLAARRGLPSALVVRRRERFLHQLSIATAHGIVANARAVAADSARTEHGLRRKLYVITNGVDLPATVAEVGSTPPTGLMVANLIAYKGHQDLIRAMRQLTEPPTIWLVGDGPERQRLEALVSGSGLEGVLRFKGSVPDAASLYADVQFAVLASHQEGLPNAVLEAMAYGVPVVATAVGGVPELIEDNVNGLLVPPHDPDALASAIRRLAGDGALRERLGVQARIRAEQLSWGECVSAHERLYGGLLKGDDTAMPKWPRFVDKGRP